MPSLTQCVCSYLGVDWEGEVVQLVVESAIVVIAEYAGVVAWFQGGSTPNLGCTTYKGQKSERKPGFTILHPEVSTTNGLYKLASGFMAGI